MKAFTIPLIAVLRNLPIVNRFLNSFPAPDFNVEGCFDDKEFFENIEPHAPAIIAPADIEVQIWCEPSIGAISFI